MTMIYLKNHSLDSFDFLHEVKWQWILKSGRPKILKKNFSPSSEDLNGRFRTWKSTLKKKALKCLIRFFNFWNDFSTSGGSQTWPGGLFPKMFVFWWQEVKSQFWSIWAHFAFILHDVIWIYITEFRFFCYLLFSDF